MAGPVAVGCALGLIVFAGAGLVPGYPGASMHPGRCLSFAISRWDFAGKSMQHIFLSCLQVEEGL